MDEQNIFELGLIINPIAGMGGPGALKGTDSREILEKAISMGAKPTALERAKELLQNLTSVKSKIKFLTCPSYMGENSLREMEFNHSLIHDPLFDGVSSPYDTTNEHTKVAAKKLIQNPNLRLLIFIGGDGTARDILNAIDKQIPCLGIPAGVKVFSSVFSMNPRVGARLILQYLWDETPLRESEVLDVDEEAYRKGTLDVKIYGYMLVPHVPEYSQASKMGTPSSDLDNQERIAKMIIESMEDDTYYLLGPGTTIKVITDELKQEKTLLGVDLMHNRKIVAKDLNEQQILEYLKKGKKVKIILSPIGKQGFILGRGNLQFSPTVLKKIGPKNLIIVSTKYKLSTIKNGVLKIDTRDSQLDEEFKGFYRVIVDQDEIKICEVK
ncbi:MAG: ATP-NAD kinase family protein [Promethearchaeota archaeon]